MRGLGGSGARGARSVPQPAGRSLPGRARACSALFPPPAARQRSSADDPGRPGCVRSTSRAAGVSSAMAMAQEGSSGLDAGPPEGHAIAPAAQQPPGDPNLIGVMSMKRKTPRRRDRRGLAAVAGERGRRTSSLHPNTIPAGAFATIDVRVPGEQEGAYVTKVDMEVPPGFVGVDYANVPGWSTKIVETKLATPITEDGETIDTEVSQIVWTWTGPVGQGRKRSVRELPAVGRDPGLGEPARRSSSRPSRPTATARSCTGSNLRSKPNTPRHGSTSRPRAASSRKSPATRPDRRPARAAPRPRRRPPASSSSGGSSEGLAIAALIVGALGLAAGAFALIRTAGAPGRPDRRQRSEAVWRPAEPRRASVFGPR